MNDKQELLTKIVKTWNINMEPEFRGFRCAQCQQYNTKAWHHQLDSEEYLVPVHLCKNCQKESNIEGGEFKAFQCDTCDVELAEAWHVWNKEDGKLVETHLCKTCGKGK